MPRSELCRESIVGHEGREAAGSASGASGATVVPVKTEGRRHSSVAGRELAGDEGMLASSNK